MLTTEGVPIGNVSFAPKTVNHWHVHHKGGQILLVTGGRGWYQEWGKEAQELPMAVECRLVSYDKNTGLMLGEIINVSADESVLTGGKVDPGKLEPITFDPVNNTYLKLGAVVGNAFRDGEKFK